MNHNKHITMRLLLLMSLALTLTQCKKDAADNTAEYCWRCAIQQTISVPSSPDQNSVSNSSIDVCNTTEAGIRAFEHSGTSTSTSTSGGFSATVKSVTTCNKQ